MDEITEKRIERDVEHLGDLSKRSAAMIDQEMGDMSALNAEMEKYLPQWAAPLMTMPSALVTYTMSVFSKLGAPPDYAVQLLAAEIDDALPRLWPQPGAAEPAWLVPHQPSCDACKPGGREDMASQCARLLLVAYDEINAVVAGATFDERRLQTMAAITFMVSAFGSLMVA